MPPFIVRKKWVVNQQLYYSPLHIKNYLFLRLLVKFERTHLAGFWMIKHVS